jgi:hypothetical protein
MKRKFNQSAVATLCLYFLIPMLFLGCTKNIEESDMTKKSPERDIHIVKEAYVDELMSVPGVVGVYVGALDDGTPCIGVMVVKLTSDLEKRIPKASEGHPVRIEETGEIKPLE